jgi:hypothetical protein
MKKIFGNKKLLIIILSAIVLVGVAVAIVLIGFGDKEEDPYQLKLDEFKQLILDPEENAEGLYDGMKAVRDAALAFGDDAMDKLGYVSMDLNHDGKEELFIGCFDDEGADVDNEIYAAFTYDGGVLRPIFEKQKRNTFALTDTGTVYFYGTDGDKYHILAEYQLTEDGELICLDYYFTYPKNNDLNNFVCYHNTTGVFDPEGSEEIQMTAEELEAKRQELAARTEPIDAVKFSEIGK